MSKEVSINLPVFQANVSNLKTSVANIESNHLTNAFSKTNIEPFTKGLENANELMELLERYKSIVEADAATLEKTGEQIREKDAELAPASHPGRQRIR
ncbi:TIGR04197 family type VII secretion effector [Halalkalibacter hemicellulosilyticus]|uniref:Type VII secretion effector n=1 Tax=Halalkalibacter hemicellulosilyticusJCM 9152 TaxID=1236971 RepID=W4QL48_9BACI|nr:TIGR04197 family type VII secretion effector [Halalkalibacter hemicellulosilyticus]GAE32064.1 hypothetical protein JCM9152_3580 [Halalkalibacter hemicellulosilyticusJCM 9152]